jgi:hypothetical protein
VSEYKEEFDKAVGTIASHLHSARGARDGFSFLSPGDVADLRRMRLGNPPGAFWRLMALVPPYMVSGEQAERRWALVCQGMAWMAPNVHDGSAPAGRMLALSGFSSEDRPLRINRLLRSEGEAFEDLFLSACRFLASRAQPVDWRGFAALAIRQGDTERKTVARDFYTRKAIPAAAVAAA